MITKLLKAALMSIILTTIGISTMQGMDISKELQNALYTSDLKTVKRLIPNRLIKLDQPIEGETPLHLAAYYGSGNPEVLKYILKLHKDANIGVNLKNSLGQTSLYLAVEWAGPDLINDLITQGADINAKTNMNDTAINHAASFGNLDAVKILAAKDADPLVINNYGSNLIKSAEYYPKNEKRRINLDSAKINELKKFAHDYSQNFGKQKKPISLAPKPPTSFDHQLFIKKVSHAMDKYFSQYDKAWFNGNGYIIEKLIKDAQGKNYPKGGFDYWSKEEQKKNSELYKKGGKLIHEPGTFFILASAAQAGFEDEFRAKIRQLTEAEKTNCFNNMLKLSWNMLKLNLPALYKLKRKNWNHLQSQKLVRKYCFISLQKVKNHKKTLRV